jgi:hypothetical protein
MPARSRPCIVAPTSDTGGSGSVVDGVLVPEAGAPSSARFPDGCRASILVISVTVLRKGDRYGDLFTTKHRVN